MYVIRVCVPLFGQGSTMPVTGPRYNIE